MAKTTRFQVVLWQMASGLFTGRLLDEDDDGVAVGATRKEVLSQLKDYLQAYHKCFGYVFDPEFKSPKLRKVKLSVYPEYAEDTGPKQKQEKDKKRTFACERVRLRLPCVTGERAPGLFTALLPTIDVAFDYHDEESFGELAEHYVKAELKGETPQALSRCLPPELVELDEVVVSIKERPDNDTDDDATEQLRAIADHLGARTFRRGSRTWERQDEVVRLESILGEDGTSVCLVGESGSGKTSILTEAAKRIELHRTQRDSGKSAPKLFWLTSAGRIVSGMRYLGQWEERFEDAVKELGQIRGILCVENLLDLVQLGGEGPESSIGALILPFVQNGELRLVAEATPRELEACDRMLAGLVDSLQLLRLAPLEESKSLRLMRHASSFFEQQEKVTFAPEAIDSIYQMFKRFQPYVAFPGKVMDFMGQLAEAAHDRNETAITTNDVRASFGQVTGLPEAFLRDDVSLEEGQLMKDLSGQVIGQDEAVRSVTGILTKFKSGLNDPRRPLGVFLFCGPTGVGKTALVRALGNLLFAGKPEKDRLIRLDMSEYAGYDASLRLLGNPLGKPSDLIRRLRANPFTVLLLDEIEKASDAVFDIFLNVFEEGRLTDAFGRATSFHSSIIIMTSNLGASASGPLGFGNQGQQSLPSSVDHSAVKQFFRPEFFNRLDRVVTFQALSHDVIRQVTVKELDEIGLREGLLDRNLTLVFSDELIDSVARAGFDPTYGARPLQRKIEEMVTTTLARFLVEHPGLEKQTLQLSLVNDKVCLKAVSNKEMSD